MKIRTRKPAAGSASSSAAQYAPAEVHSSIRYQMAKNGRNELATCRQAFSRSGCLYRSTVSAQGEPALIR